MKHVYKDGKPCDHPGCIAHISHPCENCGRIGAKGKVVINDTIFMKNEDNSYR